MKNQTGFTSLEILGIAIRAEQAAAGYYQKIIRLVPFPSLRDKLKFLVNEEKRHQRILTTLYRQKFPEVQLIKPRISTTPEPIIPPKGKISVSVLLKYAMKAEQAAEKFYLRFSRQINDTQGWLLLTYLAKVENSHYYLLKNELDLITAGHKVKELRQIYQGDRAVHVGP
ncbi:MAG: ferritin family protein [Planctomycetota bacterium]